VAQRKDEGVVGNGHLYKREKICVTNHPALKGGGIRRVKRKGECEMSDVYKWCDGSIIESAVKDGFSQDEITRNLDGVNRLTKSPRITRLIRMAYWRGCRRGVDMVRQANMHVSISVRQANMHVSISSASADVAFDENSKLIFCKVGRNFII